MKLDIRDIPLYYINLDSKVDDKTRLENLLFETGFKSVNRISGTLHEDPKVGCALSHLEVMGDKSIPTPFILIEDDVDFTGVKFEYDIPDDVDALYIGTSKWGRFLNHSGPFVQYQKVNDDIVRVYNMLSTHAIIYFNDGYREHLRRTCEYSANVAKYHLDVEYAENQKYYNIYALDVPFFTQMGYNNQVTNQPVTQYGMDLEQSAKYFELQKWKLNLSGIPDGNGGVSFYDPRHWTQIGNP